METTAANVHVLTPAAELVQGSEEVIFADADYQGIDKRKEMEGLKARFRIAIRPDKRRTLPDKPDGRLENLIEMGKTNARSKVEHAFRVVKQQLGF